MVESLAPVYDPTNVEPLGAPSPLPVASTPVYNSDNTVPLDTPNEIIYSEKTNQMVEAPHGTMARIADVAGRAFHKGSVETRIGMLGFEMLMGNETPEIAKQIEFLHDEAGGNIRTKNFVEEGVRATSQMLPMILSVFGKSAERAAQGGIGFGTAGLAFGGIGVVPGFFSGIGAGTLTGAAEQTFILEA